MYYPARGVKKLFGSNSASTVVLIVPNINSSEHILGCQKLKHLTEGTLEILKYDMGC